MRLSYIICVFTILLLGACHNSDQPDSELSRDFFEKGKTALKKKEISEAIENLEIANDLNTDKKLKEDIQFNLAYAYYYAADYHRSINILNALPKAYDVLWLKGLCQKYSQNYENAVNTFEQAIEILPTDAAETLNLKNWIANCYVDLGQYTKAIVIYKELIRDGKSDFVVVEAKVNLGYAYMLNGHFQQSVNVLKEVVSDSEMIMAKVNLAEAYYRMGETAQARSLTEEVLAHPDLTLREQDLAQLLKAEMAGVDITYLKERLSQPDKSAEVTRAHAQKGYEVAEARMQSLEELRAANNRQLVLIIIGGVVLLAALQFAFFTIRYRNKVRHMRAGIGYVLNLDSEEPHH